MNRLFNTAWVLLTTAATLTFLLTGFTLYNFGDLKASVEVEPIYCGTTDYNNPSVRAELENAEGIAVFKANCKACHSIDHVVIGPALRGVYTRVPDEKWLRNCITNSSKLIASGDPYANAVFKEYKDLQMTNFSGMSEKDMTALIDYLKSQN